MKSIKSSSRIWVYIILGIIVVTAIIKFDTFKSSISFRDAKVDIEGTQIKPEADNASNSSPKQSDNNYTTYGNQSPIINSNNGKSVINYGSK